MGITEQEWDLHDSANQDASRHEEKLKDAFRKQLKEIISQEDIITQNSDDKIIKVPIRSLDTWRFIFNNKQQKHVAQGDGKTKEGDIIKKEKGADGEGDEENGAGNESGVEYYEAEIRLEDLIEMMLEDLHLPRLDPKKSHDLKATNIRYDDIRRKGAFSNLDKKRSLVENIKRNAREGDASIGDLNEDDLRFRSWNEHLVPITSAAVIAMMDVSGSMTEDKKYLARSFFFWMVNFLRHKYNEVEIVFISHTTTARICTEHEFFYQGESGGTMCSSAYELALDVIDKQFDVDKYNIFAFHFSDGETWNDEEECVTLVRQLSQICNMVGYGEINTYIIDPNGTFGGFSWPGSSLAKTYYQRVKDPHFVSGMITKKEDVWNVLKKFFSQELVEQ